MSLLIINLLPVRYIIYLCPIPRDADQAEERKKVKYADLQSSHLFVPVAIETAGAFGKRP